MDLLRSLLWPLYWRSKGDLPLERPELPPALYLLPLSNLHHNVSNPQQHNVMWEIKQYLSFRCPRSVFLHQDSTTGCILHSDNMLKTKGAHRLPRPLDPLGEPRIPSEPSHAPPRTPLPPRIPLPPAKSGAGVPGIVCVSGTARVTEIFLPSRTAPCMSVIASCSASW